MEEFANANSRRVDQIQNIELQMIRMEEKVESLAKKSELFNDPNRHPVMMNRLAIPDQKSLSPNKSTKSLKETLYPNPSQQAAATRILKSSRSEYNSISHGSEVKSARKEVRFEDKGKKTISISHSQFPSMDIGAKSDEQEAFGKYVPNETVVDECLL